MTHATLNGRSFDVDLGPFIPRLTFLAEDKMRLQAQIGPATVDEVIPVDVRDIRPDVFLVSWQETNGNYIVQLQDHQNGVVHNRARLADGNLFEVEGTIRPA
jgi:hypothetical protein